MAGDFNFELSDEQRELIQGISEVMGLDADKVAHALELVERGLLSTLEGCPNCGRMLPDEIDGARACRHCGWEYALGEGRDDGRE